MRRNLHINWFNLGVAVVLSFASAYAGYQLSYHTSAVSGWNLIGFGVLVLGAGFLGVLVALSFSEKARWLLAPAGFLGIMLGVGATLFIVKLDVIWWQVLLGLTALVVFTALVAMICVTTWSRPYRDSLRDTQQQPAYDDMSQVVSSQQWHVS